MSNFKDWFEEEKKYYPLRLDAISCRKGYEAGAASRQAEIDSINRDLNHAFATVEAQCEQIDALQKRIDDLKKMAFNLKTDLIRENHVEYDKGWKDCATSFYHEILKGESE